mgnify:CR=1 FL=1
MSDFSLVFLVIVLLTRSAVDVNTRPNMSDIHPLHTGCIIVQNVHVLSTFLLLPVSRLTLPTRLYPLQIDAGRQTLLMSSRTGECSRFHVLIEVFVCALELYLGPALSALERKSSIYHRQRIVCVSVNAAAHSPSPLSSRHVCVCDKIGNYSSWNAHRNNGSFLLNSTGKRYAHPYDLNSSVERALVNVCLLGLNDSELLWV